MEFCELALYEWCEGKNKHLNNSLLARLRSSCFQGIWQLTLSSDTQLNNSPQENLSDLHFSSILLDRVLSTRFLFRQTWKGNKGSPTGHNGHSCNWREEVARCARSQEAARSDLRLRSRPPVVAAWNAAERREECRWAAEEFTLSVLWWTNQIFTVFLLHV